VKIALAPIVPFVCERVHHYLGYEDRLFGDLTVADYQEATRSHQALIYAAGAGRWEVSALPVGQKLREPERLITKLPPEMVEDERQRLGLKDE
jgi:methionyl-tRNA synthetase